MIIEAEKSPTLSSATGNPGNPLVSSGGNLSLNS